MTNRELKTPGTHAEGKDAGVMGELLAYNFLFLHFGLSMADLAELVRPLPEPVRDPAKYWTVLYLCWVYRMKLRAEHGDDFFDSAFQSACKRFAMSAETAKFADELRFWFERFDAAATNLGQTVQGVAIPMEYFAALSLLGLSADSPFFRQADVVDKSILRDFAAVLEKAKRSTLSLINLMGDGGPALNQLRQAF